jgi:hypothetical protein
VHNEAYSLSTPPKSERVVRLLSACIRTITRRQYSEVLPVAEFFELARNHDLRSALKAIKEKMDLHATMPDRRHRLSLAVAEAAIGTDNTFSRQKVIAVRGASVILQEEERAKLAHDRILRTVIRSAQDQAHQWSSSYSRFQTEISKLYNATSLRIDELGLPAVRRIEARAALEQIIQKAVEHAGQLS